VSQKNSAGWVPAILGGVVGATLTAGVLFLAGPALLGERMVRDALEGVRGKNFIGAAA